jgi:hypothetical protein
VTEAQKDALCALYDRDVARVQQAEIEGLPAERRYYR